MTDIVERLRDASYENAPSRCMEAARDIERLRQRVALLDGTLAPSAQRTALEAFLKAYRAQENSTKGLDDAAALAATALSSQGGPK